MTYSSSGSSLVQTLDMDMALDIDQDKDSSSSNRNRDAHVDQLPSTSTLAPSNSPSFSSSDLSELQSIHHTRSASHHHNHNHNHHSRSTKSDKSITHNILHRAHLHLHRFGTVDEKTSDEPADHSHSQLHNTGHHSHHSHQLLHRSVSPSNLRQRAAQPDNAHSHADPNDLKPRAEQDLFTQVVQTVSVVQVVDAAGSPIEVQTHYAPPATVVVDSATGVTVAAISDPEPNISVAAAASDPAPAASYNAPSPPAAAPTAVETPGLTNPLPSVQIPDATVSDSVPEPVNDTTLLPTADLPSDPVPPTNPVTTTDPDVASQETTSPAAPTTTVDTTASDVSGSETLVTTDDLSATTTDEPTQIETTSDFTSEATQVTEETSEATAEATTDATQSESNPPTTTTTPTTKDTATRARSSSTVVVVSSTFVTSSVNPTLSTQNYSDSVYSSISAEETWSSGYWGEDDSEGGVGGAGGATADGQPPAPTNSSSANDTDTGTLSPQQKQVIGGVVGSVAGVAFLAFFVLFALRYKKKHPGGGILGGNQSGSRSIAGPMSGPDGGSMAERSSASAAVSTVLAGLIGRKQQQTPEPEPEPVSERGFYRVSGKKLPSVLQVGGDGYSDPRTGPPPPSSRANRESVMSGTSDYWRGSMAWDPSQQDSHHLALGTPMRPISGVPVIRSGPARTPVTESNPFTDPPRPKPDGDGLGGSTGGGSVASRDGSFGSPSRFQERI